MRAESSTGPVWRYYLSWFGAAWVLAYIFALLAAPAQVAQFLVSLCSSLDLSGGGFISLDPERGRYAGALELTIFSVTVNATAIIAA